MAISLEEIVRNVNDLPTMSSIAVQVIRLTEDPYSTVKQLDEAICRDQAMAAKVLRLSNSAYYGYSRHIATIVEAIGVLGFSTIRDLVVAASVNNVLNREVQGYQMARGEIWRHSITCAMTARAIAQRVRFPAADRAFIAGLMHDIGKVILNIYMVDSYGEIIERVRREQRPFSAVEEDVLGFTHATVGGMVADKWNLPTDQVEAIACHHTPLDARESPQLTAIIHLADVVCMAMGIGLGGDALHYSFAGETLALFGLNELDMELIMAELAELMGDINMLN